MEKCIRKRWVAENKCLFYFKNGRNVMSYGKKCSGEKFYKWTIESVARFLLYDVCFFAQCALPLSYLRNDANVDSMVLFTISD